MYAGGPPPRAALLKGAIDDFGVEAVLGRRVLAGREIRAMQRAEAAMGVCRAHQEMEAAGGDWVEWEKAHPRQAELFKECLAAAKGITADG